MQHRRHMHGNMSGSSKRSGTINVKDATNIHMCVKSSGNERAVQVANIVSDTATVFWREGPMSDAVGPAGIS